MERFSGVLRTPALSICLPASLSHLASDHQICCACLVLPAQLWWYSHLPYSFPVAGWSAKVFPVLGCPCRIKGKNQSSFFIQDFKSSVCTYQMSRREKIVVKRKQQDEEQYVGQPHLSIKVSAVQVSVPNSSQEKSGEGNLPRGRSRAENFSQVSIPLCKSLERQKGSEQYISHVPQVCITLLFSKASGKTQTKLSYVRHI